MHRRVSPPAAAPTTFAAAPPSRRRGAAVDRLVLDAARDLLLERPLAELRMEHVAERAGVAKTSLYRRWPSRGALAAAVLADLATPASMPTDRADTRAELVDAVADGMRVVSDAPLGGVLLSLLSEVAANQEVRDALREHLVAGRQRTLEALVLRGIERGDIRADTDVQLASEWLSAPTYYRLIFGGPLDDAFAAATVDAFLNTHHSSHVSD